MQSEQAQQEEEQPQQRTPCQTTTTTTQPQQLVTDTQEQPQQHHAEPPSNVAKLPAQQAAAPAVDRQTTGFPGCLQLGSSAAPPGSVQSVLDILETGLRSPDPFRPRSFITSDAQIAPASKRPRTLDVDMPPHPHGGGCQETLEEAADGQGAGGAQQPDNSSSGSAGLGTGTVAAKLAAEAARSAALERYTSMALLSPTGGFLLGPMKTPRFSGILSADMEPQAPQDTPAAGLGSARAAGVKRSYGAATLDREADRCTEVCEAAQAVAMSSPTQGGGPSLGALQQWQQTIEAAELQWGSSHPAVGRAWLELARALQAADKDSDRAKHATKKAFDICQILLKQTGTESHAQESFEYLLAKFNTKATAAKQAAAADSAREAAAAAETLEATSAAAAAAAAAAATQIPTSSQPLPAPSAATGTAAMPPVAVSAPLPAQQQLQAAGSSGMSSAPAAVAVSTSAEQLPLQYMQPTYVLYPPASAQGYPNMMPAVFGGLPAAVLMQHTQSSADCLSLSLVQPSLLFASPVSGRFSAAAAAVAGPAAAAAGSHTVGGAHSGSSKAQKQVKTPRKKTPAPAAAAAAAAATARGANDSSTAGQSCDQKQ